MDNKSPKLDSSKPLFVEVLLPLAIPQTYTYAVPIDLVEAVLFGVRVEVPLRNRLYSGLVMRLHQDKPIAKTKNVISVLDEAPIIQAEQASFWTWMAKYYCAQLGEVMNVALPSGLKLASESTLILNEGVLLDELELSDDEYLISEAMSIQHEMTIDTIKDILNKKTVYPLIKSLMQKRVLYIKEELKQKFKPRTEDFVVLLAPYDSDPEAALDKVTRSEKQGRALLAIMSLAKKHDRILKKSVYEMADVNSTILRALEKKDLIRIYAEEVSRIKVDDPSEYKLSPLTAPQSEALAQIQSNFEKDQVTLLHGITGSGKTRIYVDLILEVLERGGQVLLLLPEIALTTQIVSRLMAQIGAQMLVYHSKINDHERVEIWNAAMFANRLFVGARSSIFLPFSDLQLVIVDEEHDPSYKQDNSNPKYQGRDSAIMLAKLYGAQIILGTATPSLESMYNCQIGKYGLVSLDARYGNSVLPDIEIINLKESYKKGLVKNNFSRALVDAINDTVAAGDQVILFQNRRGGVTY